MSDSAFTTAPVTGSAAGLGLASFSRGVMLDVWYPSPSLGPVAPDVPNLDADTSANDYPSYPVAFPIQLANGNNTVNRTGGSEFRSSGMPTRSPGPRAAVVCG